MIERPAPYLPNAARATDWIFVDAGDETTPVHVTEYALVNNVRLPGLTIPRTHDIEVRSGGQHETLLTLVVHPDNCGIVDGVLDNICGVPVLVQPNGGWESLIDEPATVPLAAEDGEVTRYWCRVTIQVRSVSFVVRPRIKPTADIPGPQSSKPTPHKA
jgi:hypothetical protein